MLQTAATLVEFSLRLLPGLALIAAAILMMRRGPKIRILLYTAAFILIRDTMTPLELWDFGSERGFFWIRFSEDPYLLGALGIFSLVIVIILYLGDRRNRRYLTFFKEEKPFGISAGLLGCALVVLPFFIGNKFIPVELRGGTVALKLLPMLAIPAFLGNLLEETLFRGYIIGILEEPRSPALRGVISGIIFALCHIFLATTVTDAGLPLLLFALWEGVIAGLVGVKYGIIPATLTHGGAIFLMSSGLI